MKVLLKKEMKKVEKEVLFILFLFFKICFLIFEIDGCWIYFMDEDKMDECFMGLRYWGIELILILGVF